MKKITNTIKVNGGETTFVWHPDIILGNVQSRQVYGFCVMPDGTTPMVRDTGETRFTLPGGGVDEGESPEEALVREFEEKVQFRPKEIGLLGSMEVVTKNDNGEITDHHQQVRYFCKADTANEFVPLKDGYEIEERIFIDPKNIPQYIKWVGTKTGKPQYDYFLSFLKK